MSTEVVPTGSPDANLPGPPVAAPGPSSVHTIGAGDAQALVIGTAHVSQRSVEEVREVIRRERPEVVCVELCQARHDALTQDKAFRDLDIFKVIKEGKTLYLLAHLGLTAYQRKMGAALGVKPGAELLAAVETAHEVGARVDLIDRDVNVTLKRTWSNIGLWKRSMMLSSLMVGFGDDKDSEPVTAENIEKLKEQKALGDMLDELSRHMPEVKGPLIDERDQYLADGIHRATQSLTPAPSSASAAQARGPGRVVAVVGAAHVPGIRRTFGQPVDKAALDRVPPPSKLWLAIKWLVPALLIAAFIFGWRTSSSASFAEMMLAWIVPTSVGAGLLTLLGGGHLLTVLTAIVVAPIAAIHPLLGTAMATGIVEAYMRKPSVRDCERLPDDILTFKGFWKNPVTRILIIAVLSGLGTAAGFWVGVVWVAAIV